MKTWPNSKEKIAEQLLDDGLRGRWANGLAGMHQGLQALLVAEILTKIKDKLSMSQTKPKCRCLVQL